MRESDAQREETKPGPVRDPRQFLVAVILAFLAPIGVIMGLVIFVTAAAKPSPGVDADDARTALEARIKPVGAVAFQAPKDLEIARAISSNKAAGARFVVPARLGKTPKPAKAKISDYGVTLKPTAFLQFASLHRHRMPERRLHGVGRMQHVERVNQAAAKRRHKV